MRGQLKSMLSTPSLYKSGYYEHKECAKKKKKTDLASITSIRGTIDDIGNMKGKAGL